jgi:hypothetical protein
MNTNICTKPTIHLAPRSYSAAKLERNAKAGVVRKAGRAGRSFFLT